MAKPWQRVLAGDIGGTNTRLTLYERAPEEPPRRIAEARLPSADHPSLRSAIDAFLAGTDATVDDVGAAAFGIAGPVVGRRVTTTNLPWVVDADELADHLGVPRVQLLNDFDAVALGIHELAAEQLPLLKTGTVDPNGPRLVVGAGTGLGVTVAIGDRLVGSEGGHLAFAPRDDFEDELLAYLRVSLKGRVSVERVVSGPGLAALYEFVRATGRAPTTDAATTRIATHGGGAVAAAASAGDAAARLALERFVSAYGAAVGELALAVIPTGGLYVAGGIAPQLHRSMSAPAFAAAFIAALLPKGRMQPLLEATEVRLVDEPDVGLLGARRAAFDVLG